MSDNPFDQFKQPSEYFLVDQSEEKSIAEIQGRIGVLLAKVQNKYFWRWMLFALIVLFLLAVALVWPRNATPVHFAEKYFEAYPNYQTTSVRGNQDSESNEKVYKAYESGLYNKAIGLFKDMDPKTQEDRLYEAISYQAIGRWNEANELFMQMDESLSPEYWDAYLWYSALSGMQIGEIEPAKDKLQEIVDGGGYFSNQASLLLDDISTN